MKNSERTNSLKEDLSNYLKAKRKIDTTAIRQVGSYKGQAQIFSQWLERYIEYNSLQPNETGEIFFTIPYTKYISITELNGWNHTFNMYLKAYKFVLKKHGSIVEVYHQL